MSTDGVEQSQGKQNSAGEIPPCLIGGFHDINVVSGMDAEGVPARFLPCKPDEGVTCSLDNVRLKIRLKESDGIKLNGEAESWMVDDYKSFEAHGKVGGWRFLHVFGMGETSLVLGVGHIASKVDMTRGFVEFNPNKLARNDEFWRVLGKLPSYVMRSGVSRFDLAADVEVERGLVRLEKDRRTYQLTQSKSLTEYLGQRNAPGYVKVYDKAAESGLDTPLTRVELTCDGGWSVDKIGEKWPTVYRIGKPYEEVSSVMAALAELLAEKVASGHSIEDYMAGLDYRTRKKLRDMLAEECVVPFPTVGAAEVRKQAYAWADALLGKGMFADREKWT